MDEFADAENFRGKEETLGYKDIALKQYLRVVTNLSQEFRPGFWVYSDQPMRESRKSRYVGDSRKEAVNSIDVLHDILLAKFDNDMKKDSKEIYEKIENIKEEVLDEAEEGSKPVKIYWRKKMQHYRELFQRLSLFMDRMGWLTEEAYGE